MVDGKSKVKQNFKLAPPFLTLLVTDQKHTTAQTVEDENRELHGKIRSLNSENNMLKYRNEVLMQMVL